MLVLYVLDSAVVAKKDTFLTMKEKLCLSQLISKFHLQKILSQIFTLDYVHLLEIDVNIEYANKKQNRSAWWRWWQIEEIH